MGTHYTYMLMDEFDWNYSKKYKTENYCRKICIKEIEDELNKLDFYFKIVADCEGCIIIEMGKNGPACDGLSGLLLKYSDVVYVRFDNELKWMTLREYLNG